MNRKTAFVAAALLVGLVFGGVAGASNSLGDLLQLSKVTPIGTCDALREGSLARQFGGSGEGNSKICICKSDGAAVPVFQWCSITITGASTVVCAGGNATTCP